jgi:transcription elongation factor GreA
VSSSDRQNPSLGEAGNYFLAALASEERGSSQQEVYRFLRWFGGKRSLNQLTAAEVANYAERLSLSDTDYTRKLALLRAFLVYARKKGWSETNLGTHLKARKGKTRKQSSSLRSSPETVFLTQEGLADLESELAILHGKSAEAIEEIRKAAADKDFRENAPLHAAREQRGKLEGRIMELEELLKSAAVVDAGTKKDTLRADIGDNVVLLDLDSGEELRYMLVSPSEVDPVRGKISNASPIGKAVKGKEEGEIVEAVAPAGKLRYQIKRVEH